MFKITYNFDLKKMTLKKYIKDLNNIASCVYHHLNLSKEILFDCSIVNLKTIQAINKECRNIDQPTDVISFALWDNGLTSSLLGEIFICYEKVVEQKKLYCHSFKRELCFLFLHGLLHLLGYDHQTKIDEKKMFELQDIILNKLGITR